MADGWDGDGEGGLGGTSQYTPYIHNYILFFLVI